VRILQGPLANWAARYESLRQVTTDDVTAALAPLTGATRLLALSAMRSLFGTLKARRVLFTNPAAPVTGCRVQPPPVLPLDDGLRASLLGCLRDSRIRQRGVLAGAQHPAPVDRSRASIREARYRPPRTTRTGQRVMIDERHGDASVPGSRSLRREMLVRPAGTQRIGRHKKQHHASM
jgi:hypothetical protein